MSTPTLKSLDTRTTSRLGWAIRDKLLVNKYYGDPDQMKEDRPVLYFKWLWSGRLITVMRLTAIASLVLGLVMSKSGGGGSPTPFLLIVGGSVAIGFAIKWKRLTAYRDFLSKVNFIVGVPAVLSGLIMMVMSTGLTALPWLVLALVLAGVLWVGSTKLETHRRNGANPLNYQEF